MTSDPNSSPSSKLAGKKGVAASTLERNLEFNFGGPTAQPKISSINPPIGSSIPPSSRTSTRIASNETKQEAANSHRNSSPHPSNPMSNPVFSQYQQNIQRQSREQKAVGSLLSGMAIALIASILFVAILAGYGGWVLSKQIHEQSVTVAQLETRLTEDIQKLRTGLKETVVVVENLNTQSQTQRQQIGSLQSQLEEARTQIKRSQTTLQRLENRVTGLERGEVRK